MKITVFATIRQKPGAFKIINPIKEAGFSIYEKNLVTSEMSKMSPDDIPNVIHMVETHHYEAYKKINVERGDNTSNLQELLKKLVESPYLSALEIEVTND